MTDSQSSFDGKSIQGITISELSKKITGIIFLETSEVIDKNELLAPMWIYLNPNADNMFANYQKHKLHLIQPKGYDDFEFDNY